MLLSVLLNSIFEDEIDRRKLTVGDSEEAETVVLIDDEENDCSYEIDDDDENHLCGGFALGRRECAVCAGSCAGHRRDRHRPRAGQVGARAGEDRVREAGGLRHGLGHQARPQVLQHGPEADP